MRSFEHTCSACDHVDIIPRDLALSCPTCWAPVGQPCEDLRGTGESVARSHPARRNRIRQADAQSLVGAQA